MDLSDEALIKSFQKTKDSTYFKSLVRRYQNRIYNAALRTLGSTLEAEEVVQETYIKVHDNLAKLKNPASFASWIFRIAHNILVDTLRDKQRQQENHHLCFDPQVAEPGNATNSHILSQLADANPCPEQEFDLIEQAKFIESSLHALPDSQRIVLVLHDMEGFSYEEISKIIGTSVGTVRSRIHYGRVKLRELLEPYFFSSRVFPVAR